MENKSASAKQTILDVIQNNRSYINSNGTDIKPATFETAITATKFGRFNYLLIALSIPCGWAAMMCTTTMSYVTPAAHCDLDLNLQQRGMLNAITFIGMITSAFLWGFLADTLGRKKILIVGYMVDAIFVILAGLAQSYGGLLTAKFITGLIMNGPFAALTTALSEFHCAKYRSRILMSLGAMYSLAQLIIPGLAWLVIPRNMDLDFLDGRFKLHSWNFFILMCALPSIFCSIGHCFVPESPKFLMTIGNNDEALDVFKRVYSINTGLHPDTFPIKSLVEETKINTGGKHGGMVTANRTKIQALKEGWQQISPMFFPPHGLRLLLAAVIQSGFIMGANTIRLWLPQLLTAMNDYQMLHPKESAGLCTMLEIIAPNNNVTTPTECIVNDVSDFVYFNSMIVAGTSVVGYFIAGTAINKIGKKPSIVSLSIPSGIATVLIFLAQNADTTIALAAINVSFMTVCFNIELTIVVDMFPTTLRAVAVSITLMIGRCGAVIGNLLFPYMLSLGCMPPFVLIGCVVVSCGLLSTLLPKTDMKPLQ